MPTAVRIRTIRPIRAIRPMPAPRPLRVQRPIVAAALSAALCLVALPGRPPRALGQTGAGATFTYRLADTWVAPAWYLTAGRFGLVKDVAAAPDGTLFVLDGSHTAVHVLRADGTPADVFVVPDPPPQVDVSEGRTVQRLDVGADGTLYLLSVLPHYQGGAHAWVDLLASDGRRNGGFEVGCAYTDIAVRSDGRVYLARNRPFVLPTPEDGTPAPRLPGGVDVFAASGRQLASIQMGQIFYALGVDVGPDGTTYVVNRVPSPWDYEAPIPRPTSPPAFGARTRARPAADADAPIEGIVVLDPDHGYVRTVPMVTPEDVAAGPAGVFVSRNVEIFALGERAPLYSGPPGQLVVGFLDGFVIHLAAPADGRLVAGMAHCHFQGVVRFDDPSARPADGLLFGALDRPDLEGPVLPWRIAAGDEVSLLQGRYTIEGERPARTFYQQPGATEPQSVQRWTSAGRLRAQLGLCAGSTSSWLIDPSDALWVRDVAADGTDAYTIEPGILRHRPDDGLPDWAFSPLVLAPPEAVPNLVAVAADDGRVVALDAGTQAGYLLDRTGSLVANWSLATAGVSASPSDVALGGDRVFVADGGANVVRVLDLAGAEIARWPTHDTPWRIDVADEGDVFVLGRRGWAMRYDASGSLLASWPMPRVDADAVDVAVDDRGRVLVPFVARDVVRGADEAVSYILREAGIWVFEPVEVPEAPTVPAGACLAYVDKSASPEIVHLGDDVAVQLVVRGRCPGRYDPVQIILLVDTSRSMNWDEAIARARGRILELVASLDPAAAEIGLVTFDDVGALAEPLSRDHARIAARVASLEAWGDSHLAAGLHVAGEELRGERHDARARQVIVIVTDGEYTDQVRDAFADLAAEGVESFAVLLPHGGISGFPAAFREFTGHAALVDPDAASVRAFADTLVRYRDDDRLFDRLDVTDVVPDNMRLAQGSAVPPAAGTDRRLEWSVGTVASAGITLTYRLTPLETGTWPTNVEANAAFRDVLGNDGRLSFPVPRVKVWDRSSLTEHVFLPFVVLHHCLRTVRPMDVVLVMDTSVSMSEPAPGGGTKLDAARRGAGEFLDLLRLPSDRAAVVAFASSARALTGLTGDRAALGAALGDLATAPGTRIDAGLAQARAVLDAGGERASQAAVVLLTDGLQTGAATPALAEAEALRAQGVLVFTIGLGDQADHDLLRRVATTPDDHLASPSPGDLVAIYQRILSRVVCRMQ